MKVLTILVLSSLVSNIGFSAQAAERTSLETAAMYTAQKYMKKNYDEPQPELSEPKLVYNQNSESLENNSTIWEFTAGDEKINVECFTSWHLKMRAGGYYSTNDCRLIENSSN